MTTPTIAAAASSEDLGTVVRPANQNYFPALDGLRAMAFLMVFGQHYCGLPWGWAGVDVFFVLSGFLITGILFDTQDQPHCARNFYIRRTLRIFPLYYGIILLLVVSYPIFRWDWNWKWLVWPAYLGNFARGIHPFVPGSAMQRLANFEPVGRPYPVAFFLGHFWSLCVEEQFYLIWPWVVFWVSDRRKLLYICLACVVICPVMRMVGSHTLPQFMLDQEVLYRWTPFRVDALLLGGLVALVRRGAWSRRLQTAARVGYGALSFILLAYVSYQLLHMQQGKGLPGWAPTGGLVFVDLFSACVMVMALEAGSITNRVLSLRPLRWLGRISYGAYVFHDMFHPEINATLKAFFGLQPLDTILGPQKYVVAVIAFTLTLLLSWASYRWFETPFIRLKERWTVSTPRA